MSLHEDLLRQAEQLARLDPRRPKQVNLRRAISASYYALFHLLTTEASGLYASDFGLAARISRTHNHGDMKKVSTFFVNGRPPRSLQPPTGTYATPPALQRVAQTFIVLQETRHDAEYDRTLTLTRRDTLDLVRRAREAFADWKGIKKSDDARLYLACFLLWKRWDEEPR